MGLDLGLERVAQPATEGVGAVADNVAPQQCIEDAAHRVVAAGEGQDATVGMVLIAVAQGVQMTGNLGKDRPRAVAREMNEVAVQVVEMDDLEPEGLI